MKSTLESGPDTAEKQLAANIAAAWDRKTPGDNTLPEPCFVSPSVNQFIMLSRLVLNLCGIMPTQAPLPVLRRIQVRILYATGRTKRHNKQLSLPAFRRAVGIPHNIAHTATICFDLDQAPRFLVELYSNVAGIAAVILDEQIDEFARSQFFVHFIAQEAEQVPLSWNKQQVYRWVIGWNHKAVEFRPAQFKPGVKLCRAASYLAQLFMRFSLFPKLMQPFKPSKRRAQPTANHHT